MNYEMSEILVLAIFMSVGALWLTTAIQFNRLRMRFLKYFPNEAKEYVTPPGYRSPKNVTFLFKRMVLKWNKLM